MRPLNILYQYSTVAPQSGRPGFKSYLCHFLAGLPWINYLTPLTHFPHLQKARIEVFTKRHVKSNKWANARKVLGSLYISYYFVEYTNVKEEEKEEFYLFVVIDSLQRTFALLTLRACHLSPRRWAKRASPFISGGSTWWAKRVWPPQGHTLRNGL